MEARTDAKRTTFITLAVLLAIALLVVGGLALTRKSASKSETTSPTSSQTSGTTANAATYADGTYSATGKYRTPGGQESVDVKLTLANGSVTDSNVTGSGGTEHSREHQAEFEEGYKQYVVGKPLESIKLSRVSGSSLTSQGFNDALAQIADQARK